MGIERIIELSLITAVVVFYFGMPAVAKRICDVERRRRVVNVLNIVYLLVSLGLVCFVVYDFVVYDMASDYKASRVGLVFMTVLMFCYTTFFKKKQWFR
ncbi:MAG: hypothetical protein IJK92_10995 [Bacteroidales bacterium]|nr:hypothetical protein [Bacteroidales bacterium]